MHMEVVGVVLTEIWSAPPFLINTVQQPVTIICERFYLTGGLSPLFAATMQHSILIIFFPVFDISIAVMGSIPCFIQAMLLPVIPVNNLADCGIRIISGVRTMFYLFIGCIQIIGILGSGTFKS